MSPPRHSAEVVENVGENQTESKPWHILNDAYAVSKEGDKQGNGESEEDTSRQISEAMDLKPEESKPQESEAITSSMAEEGNLIDLTEMSEGMDNGSATREHAAVPLSAEEMLDAPDPMSDSTATLRPETEPKMMETMGGLSPSTTNVYLDPTPKTPGPSRSTSSVATIPQYSQSLEPPERSPTRSDAGFDERPSASEDEREADSRSEIQSIMDQFSEEGGGPGVEEVMSPRLEFAGPLLGNPIQHPPRKSSLEPMNPALAKAVQSVEDLRLSSISPSSYPSHIDPEKGPAVPPKPGSIHSFSPQRADERISGMEMPMSPTGSTLHRPPPPDPEPEPDLPFDFHRFLEQLRHRTADPVAKFLRSFLLEFGKKQWMVHEQVKIIGDFLAFITNKMAQCDVWRDVSDAEFDNAREGMEKLVMNRLYTQTFSPAIPPPQLLPGSKSKRKSLERPLGLGRRGQHQEDVERDEILSQKVSIYGWVKEEHLDITPVGESGRRFLVLAQQGIKYSTSDWI